MNTRERADALVAIADIPLWRRTKEMRHSFSVLEGNAVAFARAYLRTLDALLQVSQTWNRHLEPDQMHSALVEIERICEQALKEDRDA